MRAWYERSEMTPAKLAETDAKPIALAWMDRAIDVLQAHLARLIGGDEPTSAELVHSALETNFRVSGRGLLTLPYIWLVYGTFTKARDVVAASDRFFFAVTEEEAAVIFPAGIPPAYAIFERGIFFTPGFPSFGPLCRAAMLLHESVHVVDARSGEPEIHVAEWDEPRFSSQTTAQAVHNPSSYASFAAQVHAGAVEWPRSARYGAGRPAD